MIVYTLSTLKEQSRNKRPLSRLLCVSDRKGVAAKDHKRSEGKDQERVLRCFGKNVVKK
jgi:hypothetical protein